MTTFDPRDALLVGDDEVTDTSRQRVVDLALQKLGLRDDVRNMLSRVRSEGKGP